MEPDLQHTLKSTRGSSADERAKQAVADGSHLPTFLPFTLGAGNLKVYIPLFISGADLKAQC